VIRFATPIPDQDGKVQGLLVANLHAQVLLEHVQELSEARAGLKAMFGDGEIDAEEVRHHHPLWWEKLERADTRRSDA
jgi:cytochrome b subunit of formate dehydrogenase